MLRWLIRDVFTKYYIHLVLYILENKIYSETEANHCKQEIFSGMDYLLNLIHRIIYNDNGYNYLNNVNSKNS